MDKQEKINQFLIDIENDANSLNDDIKLITVFRENLEIWEKRLFVAWKKLNKDIYGELSKLLISVGFEKASPKLVSVYLARVRKEHKEGKILFTNVEVFVPKKTKPQAPTTSSNNMVKGVTPTLEIQPGEKVVAPQSMAMPESKAGELVELSQVEGKPPSIRMSREESIHMEIPLGLTAQEGEMLKKWYDISWIGDEPDWSIVLKEEYLSKLNMETWDDEKENIWRHIFKLCREKYGMTESEMTTATYFERKATKDIATLRSKLAFIRARKATKYQLNIYTIGKKTRKSS